MSSIQVIHPASDPGTYQVWATDVDASVAVIHGTVQSSLWLPELDARSLHRALGEKLGITPAVYRIQLDSTFTREPTCWAWCAGGSEPHPSSECYREHSIVALTLEPHLRGETGTEPPTVDLDLEVAGGVPVVGVAVGEDEQQHKRLTVVEARQLAASLVDAADMAAAGTAGGAS